MELSEETDKEAERKRKRKEKKEKRLLLAKEQREKEKMGGESYDETLLAVIGILDRLKHEGNVAGWMRSSGLLHVGDQETIIEPNAIETPSPPSDNEKIESSTSTTPTPRNTMTIPIPNPLTTFTTATATSSPSPSTPGRRGGFRIGNGASSILSHCRAGWKSFSRIRD